MALALVPLVVTLTFGVPQGSPHVDPADFEPCTGVFYSQNLDYEVPRLWVKPVDASPNLPAPPPPGPVPRWPSDLRVAVEQNDWVVVFVGARFFRSHFIRAEIRDSRGGTEARTRLIDENGWIAVRPRTSLQAHHTYFLTLTLIDEQGRESQSHPTIGFVMPEDVQKGGTLVLTAEGDPPLPGLWQPTFIEKLLFFIVDPFVLSFMATAALLRRRRRQKLRQLRQLLEADLTA